MKATLFAVAMLAAAPAGAEPNRPYPAGVMCELTFRPDSTQVSSSAAPELSRVASWAVENPSGFVVIDGYPDNAETPGIAAGRTIAVRDVLMNAGVDEGQIILASYKSPRNERRVRIWVTKSPADTVESLVTTRGGRLIH
jgi:hypothetical protein